MQNTLGDTLTPERHEFWRKIRLLCITTTLLLIYFFFFFFFLPRQIHCQVYSDSNGRKKLRQCVICLAERDGLDERLKKIQCPVLIIHGTNDHFVSVALVKKMHKTFTNVHLEIIDNG
jgi:pimeloyl-ACP methyl ester carboxylesterase